jgi:hypothetical protein
MLPQKENARSPVSRFRAAMDNKFLFWVTSKATEKLSWVWTTVFKCVKLYSKFFFFFFFWFFNLQQMRRGDLDPEEDTAMLHSPDVV